MTLLTAKVEIGFTSGAFTPLASITWTDVSAYQDGEIAITWGRADQFSAPEPMTCSLSLRNEDARFTPDRSGSPYYPNVKLSRPIRVTITPAGGSESVRFTGYIDSWGRDWPNGTDLGASLARIQATSRTARLALRNSFRSELIESARLLGATYVFPMDAQPGATKEGSAFGNGFMRVAGSGAPVQFSGSSVRLSGGKYLTSSILLGETSDYTVAISYRSTTTGGYGLLPQLFEDADALLTTNDGAWHRALVTHTSSGTFALWIDGVEQTGVTVTDGPAPSLAIGRPQALIDAPGWIRLADATVLGWNSLRRSTASVRDVVYYPTALSNSDIAVDLAAFQSGYGDRSDVRIARYAEYAGIDPADLDLDVGVATMGSSDISGLSVLDAMRVAESTEGGVLTDGRDGKLTLQARRSRFFKLPDVTISFADEEVSADYAPALALSSVVNQVTATNAASSVILGISNSVSTTVDDAASQTEHGIMGKSLEVNAASDSAAYEAASWWVENWSDPTDSIPPITIQLDSLSAARIDEVLSMFIGSLVDVTDTPAQDSATSYEAFIEGGTESYHPQGSRVTWTLSPVGLANQVLVLDSGQTFNDPAVRWAY